MSLIDDRVNCIDCLASDKPSTGRAVQGNSPVVHAEDEPLWPNGVWTLCEERDPFGAIRRRRWDEPEHGEWRILS